MKTSLLLLLIVFCQNSYGQLWETPTISPKSSKKVKSIKATPTDINEKENSVLNFSYDKKQNLVSESFKVGKTKWITDYKYDKNRRKNTTYKYEYWRGDTSDLTITKFFYSDNSNKHPVRKIAHFYEYRKNGRILKKIEETKYDNGIMIDRFYYTKADTIMRYRQFSYSKSKREIISKSKNRLTIENYDKKGRLINQTRYKDDILQQNHSFKYNAKNLKIEEIRTYSDSFLSENDTSLYRPYSKYIADFTHTFFLSQISTFDEKGTLIETEKIQYTWDEYGNWTKRTLFINEKKQNEMVRIIDYY